MEEKNTNIHRGHILSGVAKRHKKSIVQIAKDAGYSQPSFYLHRSQSELPFDILVKYADAMDHDFSSEIPGYLEYLTTNGLLKDKTVKLTYEELLADRDNWREKYFQQLEENNKLIREKYS